VEVIHCNGLPLESGHRVTATEALSAFKVLNLEIRSAKAISGTAPFGASAYALGAVEQLPSGERLMLYADRSENESLSMESRRVFRLALGLLIQSLHAAKTDGATIETEISSPA
jgi:hypothetical protein